VPVADANPSDIQDLLGGALFKALYKWMLESGPVYLLPTGPISSFLVISDPAAAKHVLRSTDNPQRPVYVKGLVAEVAQFLFGQGFAITGGDEWRVRRKAVGPSLHRGYLEAMLVRVFGPSAVQLCTKLDKIASSDDDTHNTSNVVDMEACFSQLTLDIIGKAVFNYDFDSLNTKTPVIQAVYTALKETETRATDVLPLWKLPQPLLSLFPRQRRAAEAVELIRKTTEQLIAQCKAIVEAEGTADGEFDPESYVDEADPSVLRFLLAAREECTETQLRDDLLSMLVAGHETTGSVLTWTIYLLSKNPEAMAKAKAEVDSVLGNNNNSFPTNLQQYSELRYLSRCVAESMRLYPHPPVLLRRAQVEDTLPGGQKVGVGQDVMISVYNIHRSPAVWDNSNDFLPERFGPLDGPQPNEQNTDYKYIPFSGGPRKCVGDQFALMEAIVALAVILRRYDFEMRDEGHPEMTTGATIHTKNGLWMKVKRRAGGGENGVAAAVATGATAVSI
jgi:carotenoid epsilon hydroxylase